MPASTIQASGTAALFHALSDETRLSILEILDEGEKCVCELQDRLDAAQSRLSFHLKVLKEAGFVTDRREGRWAYYDLNRTAFDDAEESLRALRPSARRLKLRAGECCG